jgi:sulfur-oxidizing protein SoxY
MRRRLSIAGSAALLIARPAAATPVQVALLIRQLVGDAKLAEGKVKLELPVMVENGNTVGMTVSVDAPAGSVHSLHVFAEGNPLPEVLHFCLGPRAGLPRVQTRMRLATSQTMIAIAQMRDGTFWQDSVDLLVTLAACID